MTRHPPLISLEELMAYAPFIEDRLYLYSIVLILSYFALEISLVAQIISLMHRHWLSVFIFTYF